jgi:hypothetical protein
MLTLLVTFLVTAYLLGPELLARFLFGLVVPRRNLILSKSEEFTRAILWAILPLSLAICFALLTHGLRRSGSLADVRTVFECLYSERLFEAHTDQFFRSLRSFAWMNVWLLSPLYAVDLVLSIALNLYVMHFLYWQGAGWWKRLARVSFEYLTVPRIAEWHLRLSGMLLPGPDFELHVDVLTKANALYQGRVQDKSLNADGSLQSLSIASPRRFLRTDYEAKRAKWPATESSGFWQEIEGNLFVVLGSDIANLNLRYLDIDGTLASEDKDFFRKIAARTGNPVK